MSYHFVVSSCPDLWRVGSVHAERQWRHTSAKVAKRAWELNTPNGV